MIDRGAEGVIITLNHDDYDVLILCIGAALTLPLFRSAAMRLSNSIHANCPDWLVLDVLDMDDATS